MAVDVVIAAIGAGGVVLGASVPAYLGYLSKKREQELRAEHDRVERALQELAATVELNRSAISMSGFIEEWEAHLKPFIESVLEGTNWDRFLYLRAFNGFNDPEYVTAVIQLRQGDQKAVPYVDVQIDTHYVGNLSDIERMGPQLYKTEDFPKNALMRGIYDNEGITHSYWMPAVNYPSPTPLNPGAVAKEFASLATHNDEINDHDLVMARLAHSQLAHRARAVIGPRAIKA